MQSSWDQPWLRFNSCRDGGSPKSKRRTALPDNQLLLKFRHSRGGWESSGKNGSPAHWRLYFRCDRRNDRHHSACLFFATFLLLRCIAVHGGELVATGRRRGDLLCRRAVVVRRRWPLLIDAQLERAANLSRCVAAAADCGAGLFPWCCYFLPRQQTCRVVLQLKLTLFLLTHQLRMYSYGV